MTEESKLSSKQKATLAWKKSKPQVKLFVVFSGLVLLLILTFIINTLIPSSSNNVEAPASAISGMRLTENTEQGAVIQDDGSLHNQVVLAAEKQRVLAGAQSGETVVQRFSQNDESVSPYRSPEQAVEDKPLSNLESRISNIQQPTQQPNQQTIQRPTQRPTQQPNQQPIQQGNQNPDSNPESRMTEGTADPYKRDEVSRDYTAGLSKGRYYGEVTSREANIRAQLLAINKLTNNERSQMSKGIEPIQFPEEPVASFAGGQVDGINGTGQPNQSTEKPPMLLKAGDYIVVTSDFPIDSRTTTVFIAKGRYGAFKDARVRCTVTDTGEFLVPNCNQITIGDKQAPIEAMIINPKTMNGIVEQDIDNNTLMKSVALIGSKILSAWGTAKLEQGNTVVENPVTGTIRQQNDISNRDLVLAATATSIGDFQGAAEKYYAKPAVKTIPAGTPLMLVMTQNIPDWWNITKQEKGFD